MSLIFCLFSSHSFPVLWFILIIRLRENFIAGGFFQNIFVGKNTLLAEDMISDYFLLVQVNWVSCDYRREVGNLLNNQNKARIVPTVGMLRS